MEGKCPVCGAPMESNVCEYCGYREAVSASTAIPQQNTMPEPQVYNQNVVNGVAIVGVSKKDKTVALLLCIFLGYLGIHRFYVGKIGTGILYLLTGAVFGIGWIVDIILIAMGKFKDGFDLPLQQ